MLDFKFLDKFHIVNFSTNKNENKLLITWLVGWLNYILLLSLSACQPLLGHLMAKSVIILCLK